MGSAYGSRAFSLTTAIIVGACTEIAGTNEFVHNNDKNNNNG